MSREEKGRHVKAQPARLDADGTATPKTKLITHINPGHCRLGGGLNPGEVLEYQGEDGKRTAVNVVSASDRPHPYRQASAASRTVSLFPDKEPWEKHLDKSHTCKVDMIQGAGNRCLCGWAT